MSNDQKVECEKCRGSGKWYDSAQHASDEVMGHGGPNEEPYMIPCDRCSGTGILDKTSKPQKEQNEQQQSGG